ACGPGRRRPRLAPRPEPNAQGGAPGATKGRRGGCRPFVPELTGWRGGTNTRRCSACQSTTASIDLSNAFIRYELSFPAMDLRQLNAVVAVADHGSFSG